MGPLTALAAGLAGGALASGTAFYLVFFSSRKNEEARERQLKEDLRVLIERGGQETQAEFARNRAELLAQHGELRREIGASIKGQSDSLRQELQAIRETVERRLSSLQKDNEEKLEKMRQTVDEKLHATLERRLSESFLQVAQSLASVQEGLGEMRQLASGVGDLKKILTNVKTRGSWGEIQLKMLLDEMLSPDQYSANVRVKKGSGEMVEFAVRLPGKEGLSGSPIWLPVDSKFNKEPYERLQAAQERGLAEEVAKAAKELEAEIKKNAKDISEKYLDPPATTDFAIMYLPTEGLYAEALRISGLAQQIQRERRILLAGPTTFAALLNSLQMGFRTLAVEKRSGEVWNLLGKVKTQFGQFGDLLDKTQKKLQEASNSIEDAARKSRGIEKELGKVQEMPPGSSGRLSSSEESATELGAPI